MDELFKGRHFDREIIVLCVRWYAVRLGQFAAMLAPAMASLTTTNGPRDQKFHLGRTSRE
jgi:hypothetical protein